MSRKSEGLAKCPFCKDGGDPEINYSCGGSKAYVRCHGCGIFSPSFDNKKDAVAYWNASSDLGGCCFTNGTVLRRHATEVLDADGVPIKVGDTVWRTDEINGKSRIVKGFREYGYVITDYYGTITVCANPKHLTHKQPDSLERIEEDARKDVYDYWNCQITCGDCPAKVDGKSPRERYGTCGCNTAQKFDLLRRQREVLERGQ